VFKDKPGKMPKNQAMCLMISKVENDAMCMLISIMEKDTMWWIRNMKKVVQHIKHYDVNYFIKNYTTRWIMI
jgi:hypothetical protein